MTIRRERDFTPATFRLEYEPATSGYGPVSNGTYAPRVTFPLPITLHRRGFR